MERSKTTKIKAGDALNNWGRQNKKGCYQGNSNLGAPRQEEKNARIETDNYAKSKTSATGY